MDEKTEKKQENTHNVLKNIVKGKKEALAKEEKKTKDEAKELIEQLQRIQAEFENYKKRTEKEKQEILFLGKATVIVKVLDIVDNFERAVESLKSLENKEVKQGIEMIFTQFHKLLEEEGIKAIQAEGKAFDPYMHEVMKVENSEKDNIILKELQKGYMLKDKVIRTSKVMLGKRKEE